MKIQLEKAKGAPPVVIQLPSKLNPYKECPESEDSLKLENVPVGKSQRGYDLTRNRELLDRIATLTQRATVTIKQAISEMVRELTDRVEYLGHSIGSIVH